LIINKKEKKNKKFPTKLTRRRTKVSYAHTSFLVIPGNKENICMVDNKNKSLVLASNEISSPAWAVYLLTEYAAATAGVFIGQLSPSGTSRRRPRLSNSNQFSTGPQLITLPAI
jgi:hypothetical protein